MRRGGPSRNVSHHRRSGHNQAVLPAGLAAGVDVVRGGAQALRLVAE